MKYIILNNGVKIPQIGFGTLRQSGESLIDNVSFALSSGYELIDTANRYGNEVEVGEGIRRSGLRRDQVFLETKLGPTLYENDEAIDGTLKRLGVNYIDLMVLHHPVNNYVYAYKMLEKAYKEGKLKAIGLSNFSVKQIQEILDICEVKPALMQVECHPYYPANAVKTFCEEHGIALQSWFPLGSGNTDMLNEPLFVELANKYGKTTPQIILRWHIQMGFGVVPGSTSRLHIKENVEIFDFEITNEEMAKIALLNKHTPFYVTTEESLRQLATTKCNFED